MLVIRLTRKGRKNQPFFRVVVIDKRRSSKGGRAVEELGYMDPLTKRKTLKKERILHWLKVGAKASPTVHNLLVSEKIVDAPKVNKFKKSKKAPVPQMPETKEAVQATPATDQSAAPIAELPTVPEANVSQKTEAEKPSEPAK